VCGCDRHDPSRRTSFTFANLTTSLPIWQALRFQDKQRLGHGAYSRLPCSIPCRASETACHRACEPHGILSITTTPPGCPFITSIALLLFLPFSPYNNSISLYVFSQLSQPACRQRAFITYPASRFNSNAMAPVREMVSSLIFALAFLNLANGEHHMKYKVQKRQNAEANIPLILKNQCREAIHPAILTQAGTGPSDTGSVLPQPPCTTSSTH
jgi:hypothetical protein